MQLKPLTINLIDHVLKVLGVSLDYNFFNGDVSIYGLQGDSQMLIMGLIRNYLNEYGFSQVGLEDFLLQNAHSFYFHPITEILFGESLWDRQDRLGDFINKVMRAEAKEAACIKKWLHQCLSLGLNEERNPLGAARVLVFYGHQDVTPLLRKLSLGEDELLTERAYLDLNDKTSIKHALSTWITRLDSLPHGANAFFLAGQDIYRPFFATRDLIKPRRTSFCATVPNEQVLLDQVQQGYRGDPIFWLMSADSIDMEQVEAFNRSWYQQLWMQVYEELYVPNPKGFTQNAIPAQEDSALKFFGTRMRWCEENEEPGNKEAIYEAYRNWCQEAPKDRILQRPERFFNTIIRHMKEFQETEGIYALL